MAKIPSASSLKRQRTNDEDKNASFTWTISDQEVFECGICYEALRIPVYQCRNGHIACDSCRIKLIGRKCPTCRQFFFICRNRAIEKVIELLQVKCNYAPYGCQETMAYSKKHQHEKTCQHSPCFCPCLGCNFAGLSDQLYQHLRTDHNGSLVDFKYDERLNINLNVNEGHHYFREESSGGQYFLDNRRTGELGNIVSIDHIGASKEAEFRYQISVSSKKTVLTFKYTRHGNGLDDDGRIKGYFFMPSELFGSNGRCNLEIYIYK
ncbi:E3 ubiquitin-protein ligase [Melia azedarach]|uniref:E3 ubiquitin-protein ligase n=1 Tax=Melia azedarach TaxID=155640 RepID=A0ACC1X796_MELAZ|nr:E3 ubiquitin-protein ligase [Melia azedarach]